MEEGEDLEEVVPSEADRRLFQVYGNHINNNNSCHMDRRIVGDNVWQVRWRLIVSKPGSRYLAPQGAGGWQFVKCLGD